jgi:Flp pilus assembly protein TadD
MPRKTLSVYPLLLLLTAAATIGAPESITEVVKRVRPAVVTIVTYDSAGGREAQGTGFFVDSRHVITNWHVVNDASRIDARASDGAVYRVRRIAARDAKSDLASLELATENTSVSPLTVSGVTPEPGERVIVVGSPMGLQASVSDGVVSDLREIPELGHVMQISAPVSHGSSGSPVVNLRGEVVGVAQAIEAGGQNLNFAVPGSQVLLLMRSPTGGQSMPGRQGAGPDLRDDSYAKGRALMQIKSYREALPVFLSILRSNPRNYLAWFSAGHCYTQLGDYKSAAAAFEKTIEIKPDFAEAQASLGAALGLQGKYPGAITAFKEAIRLNPESAISHYGLALIYVATKDTEAALREYKVLQTLEPKMAADIFRMIY